MVAYVKKKKNMITETGRNSKREIKKPKVLKLRREPWGSWDFASLCPLWFSKRTKELCFRKISRGQRDEM